ncbi:MAG TPA: HD domain-containing protein [Spirochaetia bacterium]|nr:HD domain-containing protein [Spirochaetales bacterium]HRS65652.1 HD domain-containing protein [Spirochaetia bacterium]HOT58360.1 HD domain-containing protein [Spirochaetales bacterium]HPD80051.1 HD domain-containing protein [Spirochaetales bacterium]HQK33674.1 HD domain-containing protein [Spirochaetales bacterium]
MPYADAVVENDQERIRFITADSDTKPAHQQSALTYDQNKKTFYAPNTIYSALHDTALHPTSDNADALLFEAAILTSRYGYDTRETEQRLRDFSRQIRVPLNHAPLHTCVSPELPPLYYRDLLVLMLTGAFPEKGFAFLKRCGFIAQHWPELDAITETTHAKDFHPEGDLWQHTMETFFHRKSRDFSLSLALLLHDIGKPRADSHGGNRFYAHAEIGSSIAENFLTRLGFDQKLIEKVVFLIRYHMLPYGLPSLPFSRIEEQLSSPYFPYLLELFRCDELSTFKGPELYYEACARYKEWCRLSKNPYRTIDNRKFDGRRKQKSMQKGHQS